MRFDFSYLPYNQTNSFSQLVTDYLSHSDRVKGFYKYGTDKESLCEAVKERKSFPVDRERLVACLSRQYRNLNKHQPVEENIHLLLKENTFTVCTAHQPNLLTGYLYFVYKILHAIKLTEELKAAFPENNFVPIYYMGSEDNDIEELGTFRYNGKKFVWDGAGQTGAVGRMKTESLKPLLENLFKELGPPGDFCTELQTLLTHAYLQHDTIAKATQYLVNELFGKYGLIVLDPDDSSLKETFVEVMKDDLLRHTANNLVSKQIGQLSEHYKIQAHPRPVNLFYLKDEIRERIEKQNGKWIVLSTNIQWQEEQLLEELDNHPERFSPNVILRGLFQESILPNVAFIGGGSEVAYWLQLKTLFEHYKVFYPSIHLRQSVLWIQSGDKKLREQLGLTLEEVFLPETELIHRFVQKNSKDDWQTDAEIKAVEQTFAQIKHKATKLDPTLKASTEAALAKIRYQLQVLEKKMLRAEKRKMQDQLVRISKLKDHLFPNHNLQERVENFISYYLVYGNAYFDILKNHMQPLRHEFLIVEEFA